MWLVQLRGRLNGASGAHHFDAHYISDLNRLPHFQEPVRFKGAILLLDTRLQCISLLIHYYIMQLQISVQDGAPIYQQIVEQVKLLVAGGRLKPGDDVPPIRVLAEQLRINPNTVARAYLELEREGIVAMRQGFGTTVAQVKTYLPRREKLRILAKPADVLLTNARHLNVEFEEVVELLRERDAVMQPEASK